MQFESNSYDSKRSDQQQCNTARGNSNKCRCCSAFGIHQDKFGQAEREMLVENLNLYLSSDLRLPQTWCSSCIAFLKEVQSFRRKALAVEQELLTASQVVKCEDLEQSLQSDPLEIQISDVKTETDHELDSPFNGTNEEQIVKVSAENPIKIEPGTSTSGDFITIFKSEDESHLEPQKNLSKQQRLNVTPKVEKQSDLVPNNKDIKLSKNLELAPLSMKKLPHTSKGIYLVPVNNDSTNVKNDDELPPKGIKRKINNKKNVSKMKKNDTKSDEEKSDSQYDEESSDSDSDAVSHTKEELDCHKVPKRQKYQKVLLSWWPNIKGSVYRTTTVSNIEAGPSDRLQYAALYGKYVSGDTVQFADKLVKRLKSETN